MKTAYPSVMGTCSITLYSNIPFDNTYKNHTIISELFKYNATDIYGGLTGIKPCERFINRKDYSQTGYPYYYPRYTLTGDFNFNFSNGLIGSVTLELTPEQTNANYLKLVTGNDTYYYFVTGIVQSNFDTYTLSLELDVLMTYQDEFLTGMKDIPVFTTRKHCTRYTEDGLMPKCADFKMNDDAFAGVVPSILSNVTQLGFLHSQIKKSEGVLWLYICVDAQTLNEELCLYTTNGNTYPICMLGIPLNVDSVTYKRNDNSYQKTYTRTDILKGITSLIDDGSVHGCKVSPYPPYAKGSGFTITYSAGALTISSSDVTDYDLGNNNHAYKMELNNNVIVYVDYPEAVTGTFMNLLKCGFFIFPNQDDMTYEYNRISPIDFSNSVAPTPDVDRYDDPKLLFAPFKKYVLSAQYSGEGCQFYPELMFSEFATTSGLDYFKFETYATAYIGDNNFYTCLTRTSPDAIDYVYDNYKYQKIGLASSVNYVIPSGTNALDIFNSTQASSFYQSKVANGITSGLSIAGGIGSIIMGATMTVGTKGTLSPVGAKMIMAGAGAIAGGTAGIVNDIKSTQAKIEDLKNTPDSINISGSNFVTDNAILNSTKCLPYVVCYDVSSVVKENANDYFYQFGYQVSRDCYFNTELYYNNNASHSVDNNIFGRAIFNYVQINEDITNKINANIPMIVKQKLSAIFNSGITLWSFFGLTELWSSTPGVPLSSNYIDNWFMKHKRDNTEYTILVENI